MKLGRHDLPAVLSEVDWEDELARLIVGSVLREGVDVVMGRLELETSDMVCRRWSCESCLFCFRGLLWLASPSSFRFLFEGS